MIISIDIGNKNIKGKNHVFVSGIESYDTKPPFVEECLFYKGKYYVISDKRIPYTREKYKDERFFILTLVSICKELQRRANKSPAVDVELLLGLPPAHYGTQHQKLKEYFLNCGREIDLEFNDEPIRIRIINVEVYVQGHAALMTRPKLLEEYDKIILHDIGGFTWDYIIFREKGQVVQNGTMEKGIIPFYNRLSDYILSEYNLHFDERDIDNLITKESVIDLIQQKQFEKIKELANITAIQFLKEGFLAFSEKGIDLNMHANVFCGGAVQIFKNYILELQQQNIIGKAEFIDDINANAVGYEKIYKMYKSLKKS